MACPLGTDSGCLLAGRGHLLRAVCRDSQAAASCAVGPAHSSPDQMNQRSWMVRRRSTVRFFPGRVLLCGRRDLRWRAGRGRGRRRLGGHPARRGRGRHARPAAARGPRRPGAAGPGGAEGPGRDCRADRTRLANNTGVVTFADKTYPAGRHWAHASIDVTIVAGSVQPSKDGQVIRVHPIRHDRAKELGAFANPQGRPRRKNSATGNVA